MFIVDYRWPAWTPSCDLLINPLFGIIDHASCLVGSLWHARADFSADLKPRRLICHSRPERSRLFSWNSRQAFLSIFTPGCTSCPLGVFCHPSTHNCKSNVIVSKSYFLFPLLWTPTPLFIFNYISDPVKTDQLTGNL